MEKKVEKNEIYCDFCNHLIIKREIYKNDGSFQKDSIKLFNYDVCKKCSLEILDKLSKNIKEEDVEAIFNHKNRKTIYLNFKI